LPGGKRRDPAGHRVATVDVDLGALGSCAVDLQRRVDCNPGCDLPILARCGDMNPVVRTGKTARDVADKSSP
jgi:hypothetical protein